MAKWDDTTDKKITDHTEFRQAVFLPSVRSFYLLKSDAAEVMAHLAVVLGAKALPALSLTFPRA